MSTGLIPGPHVREHDDSFFSSDSGLLRAVVYGTSSWGEMGEKNSFNSAPALVTAHGKPESLQMLSAMAMVRGPMTVDFVRLTDGTDAKAEVTILHGVTNIFKAIAKHPGTTGDELTVEVAESADGVVSKINILVSLYGVVTDIFRDVDSFATLEALDSDYVDFVEAAGTPAWPANWTANYDTYVLTGGDNGDSTPDMSSYYVGTPATGPVAASGFYLYEDVADDEVDLILAPGISTASVVNANILLSTKRDDSVAVVDAPDDLAYTDVQDWHNGTYPGGPTLPLNTSYGVLCYPWLQYYDEYTGSTISLPASAGFAIAAAQTWKDNNNPYASPANYLSAKMPEYITGLRYRPTTDMIVQTYDRDGQNVNWFKYWTGHGITLWGQKTLLRSNSALNRMNARFTLNAIKRKVLRDTRIFSFRFNNSTNQASLKAFVEGILDPMLEIGISMREVICDDSINTAKVKEANQMKCRIRVKTLTSSEWLFFDIYVTSQSAA